MSFKRLDEVAKNASRTFEFNGEPVVFINTGDVLEGSFLHKDLSNPADLPGQAKKRIGKNDILYSEIRPGNKRYAFVDFEPGEYVVSTKFMVIEANEKVLPKYLYISLTSSGVERELKMIADSRSGTFPQVTFDSIGYLPIYVPDIAEQKEIIKFWESLDSKIHLNKQSNETLEEMAQAIFKSWFVDFDPVRAKMEANTAGRDPNRAAMAAIAGISSFASLFRQGFRDQEASEDKSLENDWDEIEAALEQKLSRMSADQRTQLRQTAELFPHELVESEIGVVPKGWGTNRIDELGEIVTGKTPPTRNPENYGDDVPFLTIPDMHGNIYAIDTSKYLSKKGADTQKNKYLPAGSVSMSCIASPGLVVLNHRECHTNQQINTLIPDEIEYSSYYFFLLRELSDEVIMKGSGGSVFKNLNKGQFSSLKVRVPEKSLREIYNQRVKPLMNKILQNEVESQSLSNLRDTLLPKLISGEVGV